MLSIFVTSDNHLRHTFSYRSESSKLHLSVDNKYPSKLHSNLLIVLVCAYEHIVIQIKNITDVIYLNVVVNSIVRTAKDNTYNFVW